MHARRAIVNAAAAACDLLATTGARVYPGRSWPLTAESAPYLLIYARQEQSASATMRGSARKLMRTCTLFVEGIETGVVDTDEVLDTIAEEVETAIAADHTLGGTCKELLLTQTDINVTEDDSARRIGVVRLTFTVTYLTEANAPATTG